MWRSAFVVLSIVAIAGLSITSITLRAVNALAQEPAEQVPADQATQINDLQESVLTLTTQVNELRWDIDDLKIATRVQDEKTDPLDVEVSADYPKWRLPYGVKIDDQRPPEVIAAAVERCKAGKGIVYMWLSLKQDNGRELRKYFGKVDWKDPAKKEAP